MNLGSLLIGSSDAETMKKWCRAAFGLIGTVTDPDGNYVQIIQWSAQPEAHKA